MYEANRPPCPWPSDMVYGSLSSISVDNHIVTITLTEVTKTSPLYPRYGTHEKLESLSLHFNESTEGFYWVKQRDGGYEGTVTSREIEERVTDYIPGSTKSWDNVTRWNTTTFRFSAPK